MAGRSSLTARFAPAERTLPVLLQRQAERDPGRILFKAGAISWSVGECRMIAARMAAMLHDAGIGRFVAERLSTGGLAVNTSGGQLSAGQAGAAGGMHGLVEAIVQLRGEAGARQVPSARHAVVAGYGMVQYRYGMCANAAVLSAEGG